MKLYLLLLLFTLFSCAHFQDPKRGEKLSIVQGITNAKEVEFSILMLKKDQLKVELRSAENEVLLPEGQAIVGRDHSEYVVLKLLFRWDNTKEYNLYVIEGDKVIDQRLVGKGQKSDAKLRLAVTSCMDDHFKDHLKIWDALAAQNPEYLLMIGDNVYSDKATEIATQATNPEIIWKRYVETRLRLPVFYQEKLIPIHALWDDHDYGANDGNEFYPYKEESKKIFETFFAQSMAEESYSPGFGVGGLLSLGDFNLYFLDGRSFRSKDYEGKHLGQEQESWFLSKVKEENSPSLIIKGDQFFGGYQKFESFEGRHPNDFKNFIDELKKIETPVVFMSGDRHMSEIMQFPRGILGRPSFEITTSPMHAKLFENDDQKNPWRVVSTIGKENFSIIENTAKDNHWFLNVDNFDVDGKINFHRELAVYIKDLQDNLKEAKKRRHGRRRYKRYRRSKRR